MVSEITLIGRTVYTTDTLGQRTGIETNTNVIAEVTDITQSEFLAAGQLGLKPSRRFRIWEDEYTGQRTLIFNGVRFSVYRSYLAKDGRVELYCEERAGEDNG